MIVTPLQIFNIQPRDANFALLGRGQNRPEGLHLSEIIRERKVAAGEKVTGVEGEQPELRMQIGFLWERALETAWKEYVQIADLEGLPFRRGRRLSQLRLVEDGIHMTPDGDDLDEHWLEESKFTWRSMRKWEPDPAEYFDSWLGQTKGYVRARNIQRKLLDMPPLHGVRFFIFWAGGDYSFKPGRGPQPTATEVRFTDEELEEHWQTVLRYRDYMKRREVEDGDQPTH